MRRQAGANQAAFEWAVGAVTAAAAELLDSLVAGSPSYDRVIQRDRARARRE
jgi:hypothetical protein